MIGRAALRHTLLAVALVAIWLGVLGWSAGMRWNTPFTPRTQHALAGYQFQARFGSAEKVRESLRVKTLGDDGTGLQSVDGERIYAADFPILRYRIANFPRTLELALVFRRGDAPDDVQTISLPSPGRGESVVDLSSFAEWRGEVTEIGFAQYAAAQLVPPSLAKKFEPFEIDRVTLQPRTWNVLFSRLRTDWFAYRPWALRSINTLGAPIETLQAASMPAAVGVGLALSLLALWSIAQVSRRRLAVVSIAAVVLAWIALDLRWLDELAAKHALTESLYAHKSREQSSALPPDESTFEQASRVAQLARAQQARRVLVASESPYAALRLVYLLLPLNAALFGDALAGSPNRILPRDALIVLLDSEWRYDAATATLNTQLGNYPVMPLYDNGALRVYRARGAAP